MSVLIVYTSKSGTTEKCVKELQTTLSQPAQAIDLKKDRVPDLSAYDTIIIGGSIHMGQLAKEVRIFCSDRLEVLKTKKIALFVCCGFADNAETYFSTGFPEELLQSAVAKECFGGEMDIDKLKGMDKFIAKMVTKSAKDNRPAPKILGENISKLAKAIA